MIARTWHGVTPAARAEEYLAYLERTGLPDYRATPGNLGVWVLRSFQGDRAHFLLVSFWDSLESIKRFAGDRYEIARYYPEDQDYLLELEPTTMHYEVLVGDTPLSGPRPSPSVDQAA